MIISGLEQAIAAFKRISWWHRYRKCAGLPWELKLDRDLIAREYSFQMGFVGMQSSVGAHLYHEGLYSENMIGRKRKTIVDFWCSQLSTLTIPIRLVGCRK